MPQVSVIIPTYNHAQFLRGAIESVLHQSFKDYEIIIIDDGSTDSTQQVVKPYLKSCLYIYQENKGRGGARNTGLKKAQGEYIAFLDADDLWLPEKLKIQINYLKAHPELAFVFSDFIVISSSGEKIRHIGGFKKDLLHLIQENFIPTLTVVAKKECFEKVGFFNETLPYAEDYEMWLRITQSYSLGYLPQVLAKYRASDYSKFQLLQFTLSEIRVISGLSTNLYQKKIKKKLGQLFYTAGRLARELNQKPQARRYFKKAIGKMPFYWRSYLYLGRSFLP
jgi:hypothetical protein